MVRGFLSAVVATVVWVFLLPPAFVHAQQAAARFEINGYSVEGAPLLRSEDFTRIVSPFIGKQKTAADIQKAQQALQQAYLDLGYCSVQVTVPKMEPDAGSVTLKLVQTILPVSKDCLPTVVLDDKRAPSVPVGPGEVAVRPFRDVTRPAEETPPPETPTQIARAPLKPLQDRPAVAGAEVAPASPVARAPIKPLQDRPVVAAVAAPSPPAIKPEVSSVPAPRDIQADVAVTPLAQAPQQPALVVAPTAPAPVEKPPAAAPTPPIAVARADTVPLPTPKAAPTPVPQPAGAALSQEVRAPTVPVPAVPVIASEQPPTKSVPNVIAAAPVKPDPVNAPNSSAAPDVKQPATKEPVATASALVLPKPPAEKPVEIPRPEVSVAPSVVPAPISKPQPAEERISETVAAKPSADLPPAKVEVPVTKPLPLAAAPVTPEPVRSPPAVIAPIAMPKTSVAPTPVTRAPESPAAVIEPVKPAAVVADLPAPPAVVVATVPASPAEVPVVEKPVQPPVAQIAAKPAEQSLPPSAVTPKPEPAPAVAAAPKLETAPATPGEVVVKPLAGAVATAPEAPVPAEVKPTPERAPVRQIQDRSPVQEQATSRIAVAPEPAAKPPSIVVQAPAAAPAPMAESAAPVESSAAVAALKFDIDRYLIEGNTLLKADAIGKVLASYTGKQKDFADVQRALEALQNSYQKAGWGAVQVTLPEQELERGEVRFEVIETRIGKIDVQGNEFVNEANVLRSVPSLKPGETPNSIAMARSLKVANESPAKQTQVSLKAGSKDGEVDATIKVIDENPRKYSVSIDNTGTSNTGQLRLGFGFQHANLWNRDHQLTFQYSTNPDHINKVTVLGLGYRIPLYERGDSIDLILGYSDVDSGTVQQLFNVSGAGLIALGRYNRLLDRIDDYEHKVTFGIDYKAFQNRVLIGTAALVPDITLHPVSIAYSGEIRREQNAFNFYGSLTYNPLPGGNDAAQSDFRASRGAASAEYVVWRYGFNYQRLLPDDWTLRLAANAQTTRNALVAGEQFGVGGANSVRGFNERAYSNDKGHQATLEVFTPDIAGKIGFEGGRLKLLAFYDTGSLARNFLQVGEQTGISADSIGLGLRLTFREKFNLRMDYAQVMHDGGADAGLRDGRRNSNTFHASAIFVY